MNDMVKQIMAYFGFGITAASFLTVVIKPLRSRFVGWLRTSVGAERQNSIIEQIKTALDEQSGSINKRLEKIFNENKLQNRLIEIHTEAHLCTIRNRITNIYYRYYEAEKIPSFEMKNLIEHYELYKKLGGNSYIDRLYEKLICKETL